MLWSTFVHYNLLQQKRWNHSDQLIELFQNVHTPVGVANFEERILELKTQSV